VNWDDQISLSVRRHRSGAGEDPRSKSHSDAGLAWAYIKRDCKESNGVLPDRERALALYRETVMKQAEVLGEDHLETMSSFSGQAWATCLTGDPETAVRMFEEVIGRQKRVLGPYHSETPASMEGLCESYERLGQKKKAIRLRRALERLE
jgi:Tetratricopeptide repeat